MASEWLGGAFVTPQSGVPTRHSDGRVRPLRPALTELLTNGPTHVGSSTYVHGRLERSIEDWYRLRVSLIRE